MVEVKRGRKRRKIKKEGGGKGNPKEAKREMKGRKCTGGKGKRGDGCLRGKKGGR